MIFVTTGTTKPFDRLLRAVDDLGRDDMVVQYGDSDVRPSRGVAVEFVTYEELAAYTRAAELVIAHAGVGTIMTAVANGKRPVVVPRRACYGEAADDHQVELARRLDALGLVTLVEDLADLEAAVAAASQRLEVPMSRSTTLAAELHEFLRDEIDRAAAYSKG